jgi:methylase of polypeptide subunit release factors
MPEKPLNTQQTALLNLLGTLKKEQYSFTTISPLSHLRINTRHDHPRARAIDPADPRTRLQSLRDVFGWSRAFEAESFDADILDCMRKADVVKPKKDYLCSAVRVSSYHFHPEPNGRTYPVLVDTEQHFLFLHSAYPTNGNDAVFFGPDTYRYLNLIDQVIAQRGDVTTLRMLDIGCGAGPGAILMARRFPKAEVFATDINHMALTLAQVNAQFAEAYNVRVAYSDLLTDMNGQFDVITANPPYLVDKDERAYRHGGGALGADLALRMLKASIRRLNPGGQFILYTGVAINDGFDAFKHEVVAYLHTLRTHKFSWRYQELDPDIFGEEMFNEAYAQTDRIAAVALIVTLEAK